MCGSFLKTTGGLSASSARTRRRHHACATPGQRAAGLRELPQARRRRANRSHRAAAHAHDAAPLHRATRERRASARSLRAAAGCSVGSPRPHARTTTNDDKKMVLRDHKGTPPKTASDGARQNWAVAPATGWPPSSSHESAARTPRRTATSQGPASALRFNYLVSPARVPLGPCGLG